MHERQAIRAAVIAQISGHTAAGTRVNGSRMGPVRESALPSICVYVDSEIVTPESLDTAPRDLTREADLRIEAYVGVAAGVDLEAALDAIAEEIEIAMDSDVRHGGLVASSVLAGTELGLSDLGSRPLGVARLTYSIVYQTAQRLTEPVDIFDTMHASYDLAGAQAVADQLTDLVEDVHE
jgi:hypothetical protein